MKRSTAILKNKTFKTLMAGFVAVLMSAVGSASSYADDTSIKWSDYGTVDLNDGGGVCWRGIAFQVSESITVGSLFVSVMESTEGDSFSGGDMPEDIGYEVALFDVDISPDGDYSGDIYFNALLATASATQYALNAEKEIDPVTLEPGTWYWLGGGVQNPTEIEPLTTHSDVDTFDPEAALLANPVLSEIYTLDGSPHDSLYIDENCFGPAQNFVETTSSYEDTSTFPALGFSTGVKAKVDSLFAQDARFNQLAAGCRRDFAQDVQALTAPTLNRYESCLFYDVTKSNISRVNSDALASYKASVTAGKTMTEAEIIAMVQNLALRYNTIDRLINNPQSVYATDLVNIGLTGLNSVASKYQAINALRNLAAQDKDTFSELQAAIAAMKQK